MCRMTRLIVIFVITAIIILPIVASENSTTTIRTTNKPAGSSSTKKPAGSLTTKKPVAATTTTAHPVDGGYSSIATDDPIVQEIASFALAALIKTQSSAPASSANSSLNLVKILSAAKQIVAGVNYKMSLQLTQGNSTTITCQVVVFDQVWTGTREVTSSICQWSTRCCLVHTLLKSVKNKKQTLLKYNTCVRVPLDCPWQQKNPAVSRLLNRE